MIKKLDPRVGWLVLALGVVCVMPSSKAPVDARQAVISDPNPKPVIHNGSTTPTAPVGSSGDFYIDTAAPMDMYGPKSGSGWGSGFSLRGPAGSAGSAGSNGSNGIAATIAVGSVTPLSAGASPTVSNGGTSSAAVFNFGIPAGAQGAAGTNGTNGTPGVDSFGSPNTRTLSFATAYQATNPAKPAIVTVNFTSTANISLSGGTTNSATVVIGSTNAVAGGTGTVVCPYSNSSTGTLTIGLNLSTVATASCVVALPAGWYFAPRQTAGTVTITSSFDQQVG